MSDLTIDTIIFDLGGVLIDWNPMYLYREVFDSEEKARWFLDHICTNEWNAQQDAGRSLAEATEILIAVHPEWEREIRLYYPRHGDMFSGPKQETVDLLEELKHDKRYRLLALTNWSDETFPAARKRFPFLGWFEGIVVSGTEKLKKPDHKLYHILFDRYGVAPEKAVFIDDSLVNVIAARELGMKGIHFESALQMRKSLEGLGLMK